MYKFICSFYDFVYWIFFTNHNNFYVYIFLKLKIYFNNLSLYVLCVLESRVIELYTWVHIYIYIYMVTSLEVTFTRY